MGLRDTHRLFKIRFLIDILKALEPLSNIITFSEHKLFGISLDTFERIRLQWEQSLPALLFRRKQFGPTLIVAVAPEKASPPLHNTLRTRPLFYQNRSSTKVSACGL